MLRREPRAAQLRTVEIRDVAPMHSLVPARTACLSLMIALAATAAPTPAKATSAKSFPNCTALNRHYPHGVGKPGARDHTTRTPVTNFKRSRALYNANTGRDR